MSGEFKRAFNIAQGYISKEWERITAVEREDAIQELDIPAQVRGKEEDTLLPQNVVRDAAHARRVLDVNESATFDDVQTAYKKLCELSDPAQFGSGTQEFIRARRIQRSIHQAYKILSEEFSITERRFKSLEID